MTTNFKKSFVTAIRFSLTDFARSLCLATLLLFFAISSAWAWPTGSQWIPVPKGGTAIQDPQNDAQGSRNVVPDDGTTSAAYIYNDGVNIYFRFRLDDDPTGQGGQGLLQPYGWGFQIDTDQNADDYEWMMMLDGISNPEVIRLMENTVKSGLGDPSDIAEDVIAPYPLSGNYQITTADSCFDDQNNPGGVCNAQNDYQDYFLDYKLPYSVFKSATKITDNSIIRFFVGSSNSANNLTENGSDLVAGSDLYEMGSDFITPFGYLPPGLSFYDGSVRYVDDLNGAFDLNIATPGDTIYIRVDDLDLSNQTLPGGEIVVTVTSPTGDLERVTLYATGVQGKYTGPLPTATTNADKTLYILSGQTATVTYIDAITANGNQSITRSDTIYFTSTETDLSVSKSVNNDTPIEGDTVTFTITVTNNGPLAATSLTISDLLPSGQLTYLSDTVTSGSYSSATGNWTINTGLAVGASATLTIDAYVEPGTNGMTLTNTASLAASSPPDSFTANDSDSTSVKVGGTDLRVTKSVNDNLPLEGDSIIYTVRVLNLGPADTTGVQVTDLLPAGITYSSHTVNQGTYTNGTGLWNVGSLNSGAGALLKITAIVDAGTIGQIITNAANLTATDQPDTNSSNDSASAAIKVEYLDLSLDKEVRRYSPTTSSFGSNLAADVSDTVEYRITVHNNGPHNATGIEVTDTIPVGLTYVASSATASTGTFNSVTGLWSLGNLDDQNSATLTFRATVDAGTEGQTLVNQAEITDVDQPDSNPGDEFDTTSIAVDGTDLRITKSVTPQTPIAGGTATWTVTVHNDGPNQATGIVVMDILPDGVTRSSHNTSQGTWSATGGNPSWEWGVGTLDVSSSATLTIVTTVDSGTTGETIVNNAFITEKDQADPDDSNNVASEYIAVGGTDLEITKTVDDNTPNVGQDVIYTLTVTNNGPSAATNVAVDDMLPPELTYQSSTPSAGSYDSGTGIWAIGNLANAASETLTITATVLNEDNNLVITNTAEVSATEADQDTSNNIAAADLTVNATDISVSKTVDNATPYEGSSVTYTVSVTNNGGNTATNVEIEDVLPTGTTYISSTPSQGVYLAGLWIVGSLTGSSTATLTIVASVDAGTEGQTIINTAELDTSVLDQIDTDDTNDSASVEITPTASANLTIVKMANTATAIPGDTITYTVIVSNTGQGSASTVILDDVMSPFTDLLPDPFGTGDFYSFNDPSGHLSITKAPTFTTDATGDITAWKVEFDGTMQASDSFTFIYQATVE